MSTIQNITLDSVIHVENQQCAELQPPQRNDYSLEARKLDVIHF
jgi:hypothetical protein